MPRGPSSSRTLRILWPLPALIVAGLVLAAVAGFRAAVVTAAKPIETTQPHALWRVVHDLCVPDRRYLGLAAPCLEVSLAQGWALVKDVRAPSHLLLVPTKRISGIESPQLYAPGAPNYWRYAWNARPDFERLLGRGAPRQDIGLVVNSRPGRTQDQLHIHIDCVKPQVARVLEQTAPQVGPRWAPLSRLVLGRRMLALRLEGAEFGVRDPFVILAQGVPAVAGHMDQQTLAAVGIVGPGGRPGFVLLTRAAQPDKGDPGAGEEILDHTCGILTLAHSR